MARNTSLSDALPDAEYTHAKYKFVLKHFPDCKLQKCFDEFITKKPVFVSPTVNTKYTNLGFKKDGWNIQVIPYCELEFNYKGKSEKIIVNSSPKRSLLARIKHRRVEEPMTAAEIANNHTAYPYTNYKSKVKISYIKVIKFARLSLNLKSHKFDEKMLAECQVNIMQFIKDHPEAELDCKYLHPRLKKLLALS